MKYLLFALAIVFIPAAFSYAQIGSGGVSPEISIGLEPNYPEPNTKVVASLNDYSLAASVSSISWKIDGKIVTEAKNQRSISLMTKEAGKDTVVDVILELSGGGSKTIKRVISPLYLDIIIEPQTRTPSFYLGRSLPSIGSSLNLTAIINGGTTKPDNLLYTWRFNNKVVEGGSLRAKNKISAITPMGQSVVITLDISKLSGELIARRNIEIPSVNPTLYFYEINSLYGIDKKPITNLNLIASSATIKAEPYNLDILTYNHPEFIEWKVDGNKNNESNTNPYEITLARPETGGISRINFHVRSMSQLLQGGQGNFQITF